MLALHPHVVIECLDNKIRTCGEISKWGECLELISLIYGIPYEEIVKQIVEKI